MNCLSVTNKDNMIFDHLDDKFTFGKYSSQDLGFVLMHNPAYIDWLVKNVSGQYFQLSDNALNETSLIFPHFPLTNEFREQVLNQRNSYSYESEDIEDEVEKDAAHYERDTYDYYAGSYAQDEMGYSDDDIETIFDGDPIAYWNID